MKRLLARLLAFVLEKHGYRVVHSNNGVHATALMATMEPPNVVLLDMALPDTTGLDLLAYLRTLTHWQKTAVALLTNCADDLDMRQAALLGANIHILKLVSPTKLATRLNRLLRDSSKKPARVA